MAKRTQYEVRLWLEIDGDADPRLVEEAIEMLLDEEIASDGTRCGLKFYDATDVSAERVHCGEGAK